MPTPIDSNAGTRRGAWIRRPGPAACAILAAGVFAAYRGTVSVPLIWDDVPSIGQNGTLRHLWPLWRVMSPPDEAGVGGRPLLNLSYALNYAAGGIGVAGYHLVNVAIHLLASWTLFALIRRTVRGPGISDRLRPAATPIALAVAAIWAWHPLQTESVTYLSQRAESLMGLCYLLTLYGYARYTEGGKPARVAAWGCLAIVSCACGMGVKEVMVTAPSLAFLYDRTFVSGSFSEAWRRHRVVLIGLAAAWIPLGCLMAGLGHRGVGYGQGADVWKYGLTESRVLIRYLGLVFWPRTLVFDYGNSIVAARFDEVWPQALMLAAILVATAWALFSAGGAPGCRDRRAAGFACAWFFLILAPSSSVVPVANQPMAENRVYLPLAGVVAAAVGWGYSRFGRRSLPAFAAIAVGLAFASARRNECYASGVTIWSDTVAKVPENPRARMNLGYELFKTPNRLDEAIAQYREALRLKPDFAEAHNNLGKALELVPGRFDEAISEYRAAVRLKPDFALARHNLGTSLERVPGRLGDAIVQEEAAVRLRPDFDSARYNLGTMYDRSPGRTADAITQYEAAVALNPEWVEARENLANDLSAVNRLPEAIVHYEAALRIRPTYAEGHYNLANALKKTPGELGEAIAHYNEALRLDPDFASAHLNLATALLAVPGRAAEAARHLEEVLRLQPGNETARQLRARIGGPRP